MVYGLARVHVDKGKSRQRRGDSLVGQVLVREHRRRRGREPAARVEAVGLRRGETLRVDVVQVRPTRRLETTNSPVSAAKYHPASTASFQARSDVV